MSNTKKCIDKYFSKFLSQNETIEQVLYSKANSEKTPTYPDISKTNKYSILLEMNQSLNILKQLIVFTKNL